MKFRLFFISVLFLLVLPLVNAEDIQLIRHFNFTETSGTTMIDNSDLGIDGTYSNTIILRANGLTGQPSICPDGTNFGSFTAPITNNWTWQGWANATSFGVQYLWGGGNGGGTFAIFISDSTTINFNGGDNNFAFTVPLMTPGTPMWVMVKRDGAITRLFINLTESVTGAGANGNSVPNTNFNLGATMVEAAILTGCMSDVRLWNRTTNTAIDECVFNDGVVFHGVCPLAPAPVSPLATFTITAKDTYDSASLTNITIIISNSSFVFNDSTVNGTIIIHNTSIPSFDSLYRIDFRVNDTGGYFNRTFLNINITDLGSFQGDLFQSVLKLMAIDGLNNQTISDFSARTNRSFDSTTTGEILILIKNGTFQLNITAPGFDKLVTSFTINALANNSLNVTMGSVFNFRLVREETNTPFNFNNTNSTDLTIFCPNETIRITFNVTNNVSQIVNCQFTLMQITVDYGILGSYFRTLIPPFSQKNIVWYLIDLIAGDTAIQKIIRLVDLTGDFSDATLTVKRAIPGETILKTMIEQKFDISSEVNLFLVKDALYTINIENDVEDIALGNLIPTEAGTQTITLPKIAFVPQETILGDNISWSYTFNLTLGILRMQYVDVTNLTTLVRFTVKNGSDPNLVQLFQGESSNNSTVTITFNQVKANTTYVSELFFEHPGLSNFTETRPWYEFGGAAGALNLEGWSETEQINFKKWAAYIFVFVGGMLWTRRYIGIGMTTLVIWLWIFKTLKWIDISTVVFGFVALLAVVGWIVEAMKKE